MISSVNGTKVLKADNIICLTGTLVLGTNTIYVVFHSAFRKGRQLEEEHLGRDKHSPAWNGDASRLFVRKAGYNYGWDWGPVLMTGGPSRFELPVSCSTWPLFRSWTVASGSTRDVQLSHLRLVRLNPSPLQLHPLAHPSPASWPRGFVSETLEPVLKVHFKIADVSPSHLLNFSLLDSSRRNLTKLSITASDDGEHCWRFEQDEVELWWPAGMGKQVLYTVKLDLVDEKTGTVLDSTERQIGFRRVRVVQEPLNDQPGTSFCFEINNTPIFSGGSNWIPLDPFLSNATPERYRQWLELLVEGHQNMVRVWGGGVYEDDAFYDTCDELGILVWQDFMFACGAYPAHPDFLATVKEEAEANVLAEAENLGYDPKDHDGELFICLWALMRLTVVCAGDWTRTGFPAREIYERLIPSIVLEHSDVFYSPGSPWGGSSTRDVTVGDIHQWDVWHGSQFPYQDFGKLSGRFVSEFGMEGAPDLRTIDYFLDGDTSERFPQSKTMDSHNKAGGFERRLAAYLSENIRFASTIEGYAYATQFIQAEALANAFGSWRRLFKGGIERTYCAGALVWQLNDVLLRSGLAHLGPFATISSAPSLPCGVSSSSLAPGTCCSGIILQYFAIKRALAPVAVGTHRYTERTFPDRHSAASFVEKTYVDVWANSSLLAETKVDVVIEAFELLSGERVHHEMRTTKLAPNRSTELVKLEVPIAKSGSETAVVVATKLVDPQSGKVLSRAAAWPEPFKFLSFPSEEAVDLNVKVDFAHETLTVAAARPVKGLVFTFSKDVKLADNALDLNPGDVQAVSVKRLTKQTDVSWRCELPVFA
ncbi:SPOSA6832_01502 [Sporobolomyces salmonicolor]|uniref:Beta-mannosidase B n=1 Tax=Sporidiobolus salmonicolor TaxID=5005 RepID=A0A0D6EJ54_SPOSA|nr:SPOSA6832_01502 [Sporobolomyces salmonicolor]